MREIAQTKRRYGSPRIYVRPPLRRSGTTTVTKVRTLAPDHSGNCETSFTQVEIARTLKTVCFVCFTGSCDKHLPRRVTRSVLSNADEVEAWLTSS